MSPLSAGKMPADVSGGLSIILTGPAKKSCLLKPGCKAKLRTEDGVVEAVRTLALGMCDVFDEMAYLLARASSRFMTLRDQRVEGG